MSVATAIEPKPLAVVAETEVAGLWLVRTTDIPWPNDPAEPRRLMTEIIRIGHWHDGRSLVRLGWGAGFHEAAVKALREGGEDAAVELPGQIAETPYERSLAREVGV